MRRKKPISAPAPVYIRKQQIYVNFRPALVIRPVPWTVTPTTKQINNIKTQLNDSEIIFNKSGYKGTFGTH
jgi:hypothetical protein